MTPDEPSSRPEDSPDRCVELLQANQPIAADFMSRRIFAREPEHPRRRSLELRVALARHDQPRAYLAFRNVGEVGQLPPALRFSFAQAAFTVGRLEEAERAIDSLPLSGAHDQHGRLARWRLRILIHGRRLDRAEEIVSTLEATPSLSGICTLARAEIALKRQDPETARRILAAIPTGDTTPAPLRYESSFLLARVLELLGDADGAFAAAARGNRVHAPDFDAGAYRAETDRLIEASSKASLECRPKSVVESHAPVLIVGMPRSGTTLIEQIIASHPDASGVGEQQTPFRLAEDLAWIDEGRDGPGLSETAFLADATDRYLAMHEACGATGARVTNKALGLERILGQLTRILPQARIIFVERDPRDLLLSIHQNPLNLRLYPWSTRLEDAREAMDAFRRLVDHWCTVLPNACMRLTYETLVDDQDTETSRLLDFLGLPYDRRCLSFEESDRIVLTPSADQVKRGMNRDGIGRWKRYQSQLGLASPDR